MQSVSQSCTYTGGVKQCRYNTATLSMQHSVRLWICNLHEERESTRSSAGLCVRRWRRSECNTKLWHRKEMEQQKVSLHRCYIISMSSIGGPEAENSAAALPGELLRRGGGRRGAERVGQGAGVVGGGGGGGRRWREGGVLGRGVQGPI